LSSVYFFFRTSSLLIFSIVYLSQPDRNILGVILYFIIQLRLVLPLLLRVPVPYPSLFNPTITSPYVTTFFITMVEPFYPNFFGPFGFLFLLPMLSSVALAEVVSPLFLLLVQVLFTSVRISKETIPLLLFKLIFLFPSPPPLKKYSVRVFFSSISNTFFFLFSTDFE